MYRKKDEAKKVVTFDGVVACGDIITYSADSAEKNRGVVLLVAVTVASLVLTIGVGILMIVSKQSILSSLAKNSQMALFAADSGTECATHWDLVKNIADKRGVAAGTYPGSIFATTTDAMNDFNGSRTVFGTDIMTGNNKFNPFCNGQNTIDVFGTYLSTYFGINDPASVNVANTEITTKFVIFPGGDATAGPNAPCALVSVTKTVGSAATSIFSEGFSSCGGNNDRRVSRGIRVDYDN